MPIGCFSVVPTVVAELVNRQSRSVLDLGIGMGFYGVAVRQWLDSGILPYRTLLHGVEAWDSYRNPCWNVYDHVFVGRIEDFLAASVIQYDAILLMDVLEHFDKPAGANVLERAFERLTPGGVFLVVTPAIFESQGAVHGNEAEVHRSLWTVADMLDRGFEILSDGSLNTFGHQMLVARRERSGL
jgi:predicted TPR repeat methyltransferase